MSLEQLKNRIKTTLGEHPLTYQKIRSVEEALHVKFSEEFIELNKICSYECGGNFDFFNFRKKYNYNVIKATLGMRKNFTDRVFTKVNNYVHLYSDDARIVLMDPKEENFSVIWCSIYDMENLFSNKPLCFKHDLFATFSDFFSYLLDEEEKQRARSS